MGRKRGFGNADSSDDDDEFQPSDGESSPVFSRLKRKRRPSGREGSATPSASGQGSQSLAEEHKQEEENEVICIPDSLDEDDEKEIEETPASKEKTPQRSAKESEVSEDDEPIAENDPVANEDEEAPEPADENRSEASDENYAKATEKKPRASTVNHNSLADSDSEPEPEASEDDDDVYKSDEDSPDESDAESDFAPSPAKPSRKPKAKEKPASRQPASKPTKAKTTPVRKPLKSVNNTVKARLDKRNETRPLSAGPGKKRLGARIPSKLSSLGKSPGTGVQRPRPPTASKNAGTVYRAGLSRNVSIPRLHSYLHKS